MTSSITAIEDIISLKESLEVEFKLAAGKEGQGEVPKDVWKTYSAMANTEGGDIFLGIREKPAGVFSVVGIAKPDKVMSDLWNTLNSAKVSDNLLSNQDIYVIELDGKSVIRIHVPRARRQKRPVYINSNPNQGTYRRFNEGDHLCSEEDVRRMMAEQVEDNRDAKVLKGFAFDDLDMESFLEYRQIFQNKKPDHPFNNHDHQEFLRCIRGWSIDRETGEGCLTLAGLLMFGKLVSIQEALPNYLLDYQERPESGAELRWLDRITLDGTWSGNLFDFYRKVIRKLYADLKVPFKLHGDQRMDETPVHEALREALINALAHADYTGRTSVLVIKCPGMFGFRNPGLMRVPVEQAIRGGESDCRNRAIHQMFLNIGLGERAGSGIPKIYTGWTSQHWRQPLLHEKVDPEQTLLELRMLDLFPEFIMSELKERLGDQFSQLTGLELLILATSLIESVVNHSRLLEITDNHPRDITQTLHKLVQERYLESKGSGRGTVYFLSGEDLPTSDAVFVDHHTPKALAPSSDGLAPSSDGLASSSDGLTSSSDGLSLSYRHQNGKQVISDLTAIAPDLHQKLLQLTEISREKKKLATELMEKTILNACRGHYLSLKVLAELLNRSPDPLRQGHLNRMVKNRQLERAYPTEPNSPKQAYTSAE